MSTRKPACEVCGNEIDDRVTSCPFCGSKRTPSTPEKAPGQWKEVNLEKGMPLVQDAVRRLKAELAITRSSNVKGLVLIHGYGSSGKGGAIKTAVRQELVFQLEQQKVKEIYPGEDFSKQAGVTKQLLRRFPSLRPYVQSSNPGITVVVVP